MLNHTIFNSLKLQKESQLSCSIEAFKVFILFKMNSLHKVKHRLSINVKRCSPVL